jgi:hypothetical protein
VVHAKIAGAPSVGTAIQVVGVTSGGGEPEERERDEQRAFIDDAVHERHERHDDVGDAAPTSHTLR